MVRSVIEAASTAPITNVNVTGFSPTVAATSGEPDVYPGNSSTPGHISLNTSVSSVINTDGDTDWFAFSVNAGYIYTFDMTGNGANSLSDPLLKVYDAYGNLLAYDDDSGTGTNAHLSVYAQTTGVMYISAEAFPNVAPYDNTGSYTLTMGPRSLATVDTVGQSPWDSNSLPVGTVVSGRIDTPADHDWYSVNLTSGHGYDLDIAGLNGLDTVVRIYDSTGALIAQNDDTHTSLNAHLDFEPYFDGTYYISVESSGEQSYGDYSVKVSNGDRPLLTDSVDWGTKLNVTGGVVKIYFAASGEVFDGQTSHGWSDHEIAQAMAALGVYSNYVNLTFVQTTDASLAQFKLVTSTDLDDDVLGYMNPPGTTNAGVGVFAIDTPAWTGTSGSDPLMPGGLGFDTLLHEFGHGLGLAHPFDGGGAATVMTGVLDTYDAWGYGYQNQGAYTIMSYNDGWPGNSNIPAQIDYARGWGESPMAIDVAVLQAKYGANANYHSGDDVYELDSNYFYQTSFWSIWDTGGTDTISAENDVYNGAVIDLRAASMYYSPYTADAGGDPSYVRGQDGAVSIDQGVIIENAIGSRQGDNIIGNDYANVIKGMGGSDTISANGGNDTIYLTVSNGNGNSAVDGGSGGDTLILDMSRSQFQGAYDSTTLTLTSNMGSINVQNVEFITFSDGTYAFNKAINVAPVFTGKLIAAMTGGQHVLTAAELGVTDFNGDALTFYVQTADKLGTTDFSGATQHGTIMVNGVAANTFSAAQLAAGKVSFVSDGTENASISFQVAAYDGQAWSAAQTFTFIAAYNHGSYLYVAGTSAADTLNLADFGGGLGNDVLAGGAGDDTYIIDKSTTTIAEAADSGWDTIRSSVSYVMANNVEVLTLTGTANINASGNAQDNYLWGNAGNNTLDGKTGADIMYGGAGNDTYIVDNAAEQVWEWSGVISMVDAGGIDTVKSSVDWTAGYYIENIILTGNAISATGNELDNILTGNAFDNTLTGNWGNDILDGGAGADTLYGGVGDDSYVVDNVGDQVIENDDGFGPGTDTVISSISYSLGTYIENLTLSGSGNLTGKGNAQNNILIGNTGNNTLNGGAGADTMIGGAGDDTYFVDNTLDIVTELNAQGTDSVYATVSYALGDFIERLTLGGTDNLTGKGNGQANTLIGNNGNNTLNGGGGADIMNGGAGNDTYIVDNAGDVIIEGNGGGSDSVYANLSYSLTGSYLENLFLTGTANINATGNAGSNLLVGNGGNNVFNGGAGADTMNGGAGNDLYYVDNAGDVIIEGNGGGTDSVYTGISYSLTGSYLENIFLTGTANINASGNAGDNLLVGNSGNNILNGGAGNDTMNGGAGDDIYYVDSTLDVVIEGNGGGIDTVYSTGSYSLGGSYVEKLFLTGTNNTNAAGNAGDNLLVGNDGNNVINGGDGADTMNGGLGDDTYYVDNALDVVIEGHNGGNDTVISSIGYSLVGTSIENLTLTSSNNINATGNAGDNHLTGNAGNNIIVAGGGNDILAGGGGNDTFVFGASTGLDYLTDFSNDTIDLSAFSHGVVNGGGIIVSQLGSQTMIDLGSATIFINNAAPSDLTGHIIW
jgi:Ca2+-binding RTX toxin-like protein